MSRPRSFSGGPAAAASNRRRRALTYDDLPPEMKDAIQDYLRFTNESLRRTVKEYFEDKAATERRYGKMNTWDVGRVTDMSKLFLRRTDFNEARAGVGRRRAHLLDARRGVSIPHRGSPRRASMVFVGHRRVGHVVGDDPESRICILLAIHWSGHRSVGYVFGE